MDPALYRERGRIFSVTIGLASRVPVFTDMDFGRECVELLRNSCNELGFHCFAYCLMPDHVHLLVSVKGDQSLTRLVGSWKSRCTLAARARGKNFALWQRSFFDHALRREESIQAAAEYIWANPVRAGLVERPGDYPLAGGFD
jgi:putative transposase